MPASTPDTPLAARRAQLHIDDRWRTSSFSALTSHAPAAETREEQIADHDTLAVALALQPAADAPSIRLADFPRGTQAGSFFHDVLEHYDFTSPRPGPLLELVESRLRSYRYPIEPWKVLVAEQIGAVLDTPLCPTDEGVIRLGDVPLSERLNELEFCVPVGIRDREAESRAINAFDLARVFREHPSEALTPRYADAVARLGFIPLSGFLRGFIDLVFRHGERFYLVDYKGNHLGPTHADYAPDKLGAAMLRGQYFLQYHLYALALHRYLGRRLANYTYERHFGGVFYLFIKGMGPDHGSAGVFYEKPPLARLLALGRLLERDADDRGRIVLSGSSGAP